MLCHGKPRRVILSEQGFHTPDGPDGQTLQAAGYCYGWIKASRLDGIDAFILNRHVDNAQEGGLRLGFGRGERTASRRLTRRKKSTKSFDWPTRRNGKRRFALPCP